MPVLDRLASIPDTARSTMQRYVDTEALADAAEIRLARPGYVELVYSLVLVWGFGDALSTVFAATFAGAGSELNPWIRVLLEFEPLLVIAVKMAVALYVGIILLECRSLVERVPLWRAWLLAIVVAGALVVLNNVVVGLVHVALLL
jgi:hypothetical protein